MFSNKCQNGNVCKTCLGKLPEVIKYSLKEYRGAQLREILTDASLKKNAEIFNETCSYGLLHIDENHGLFCITNGKNLECGKVKKDSLDVFDSIYVSDLGLSIKTQDVTENAIYVSVNMLCILESPKISINLPIKNKAACKAIRTDVNTLTYREPAELTLIRNIFIQMRLRKIQRYNEEYSKHFISKKTMEEFTARCLMMLPEDYTQEELKKQRNRLLKVYHPDENNIDENMEKYTQMINDAYRKLKK